MISLKCPKCQAVVKVDEAQAGTVSCPSCGVKVRISRLKTPLGSSQTASAPAAKTSPQSRPPTGQQTAIQAKVAKPPSNPSVRPAGASPPEPLEVEEFEYTDDNIGKPEVPAPPRRRRGVAIELEDESDNQLDEEQDEIDEEEEELPRKRKKKKKRRRSALVIPIVIGIALFVAIGCTGGLYFLLTPNRLTAPPSLAPDANVAIALIEVRGGRYVIDKNDPPTGGD